jgi:hypothetical protein
MIVNLTRVTMDDYHWASFEVVFPDGAIQTLCCELSHSDAIDAIIDYLNYSNAKLVNLRNFMSNEIKRLKEAKNINGESFFAVA